MRYGVDVSEEGEVSLHTVGDAVVLRVPLTDDNEVWFTLDEFREFRKAVGYVWQEVEQG